MGLIIKNKRHLMTRLPLWILVILLIGFSPAVIGLLGEILDSESCRSGDCIWTTVPYFSMFTVPVAFIILVVFLIIVIIDSIRLFKSKQGNSKSAELNFISLFESESDDIKVSMSLRFNEKSQLIFEGLDTGPKVKELRGDLDFEYKYTLQPTEVAKLATVLGIKMGDRKGLLLTLKERFHENDAFSKFGVFMDENDVKYETFFWE
ncbi:hypothetical protein [Jiulongibacter sediminis]|jgi:hypothetical protein|uniref:hypothetical protein n=1 Tax=Jiulongibacter sediminis TaxID=1605367 RepID=UPI0026EF784E|nr:hypothetical protein [Jiulongibacter sediminis]